MLHRKKSMHNTMFFSTRITKLICSCRFRLHNIGTIWPFLLTEASQVLVQSVVISRLDYRDSLLAACHPTSAVDSECSYKVLFSSSCLSSRSAVLCFLHWLPIGFKTLIVFHKAKKQASANLPSSITHHATLSTMLSPSL